MRASMHVEGHKEGSMDGYKEGARYHGVAHGTIPWAELAKTKMACSEATGRGARVPEGFHCMTGGAPGKSGKQQHAGSA